MAQSLYIVLIALMLLASFSSAKDKYLRYIVIILITYLVGRGAETLDTQNYVYYYEYIKNNLYNNTYEKGFLYLQKLAHFLDWEYVEFRIALTFLSYILIFHVVSRFSKGSLLPWLLYASFLIFIDTVQIRNLFAFSIVVYGIKFLFDNDDNDYLKYFKYIITILIASTIHISALAYLVFIILYFRNNSKFIYVMSILTLVSCLFIFLVGNKIPLVYQLLESLDSNRLDGYINQATRFGFLYAFVLHGFNLVMVWFALKIKKQQMSIATTENDMYAYDIIKVILLINQIAILFFPLYMVNLQFIRLSRNLLIINFIAYSLIQKPFLLQSFKLKSFNILLILNLFSWYYFTFVVQDHVEDIIEPFFADPDLL